jgi:hypothetical protein
MKLEHIFHKHDEIHLCQATGAEKHIHKYETNDCGFLHKNLVQDQKLPKYHSLITAFSGRAPPNCL